MAMIFRYLLWFMIGAPIWSGEFRVISMDCFPKIGLFATANQVLGQLYLYEQGKLPQVTGLVVDFDVFGLYYDPTHGPNWWNYYFEPISLGSQESSQIVHLSKPQYLEIFEKRRKLSRKQAAAVINKYIQVKRPILEKVEQFTAFHFQDFYVIGVHYRGTDKEKEAPKVPYEKVVDAVLSHIPIDGPYRIFVATDEAPFLEIMKEKFPQKVVSIDAHRTTGSEGIHFCYHNQYEIGEESLIDALLLSKCSLLIRTSSNLSLWSTYFNPELPTILLNQRRSSTLEPE